MSIVDQKLHQFQQRYGKELGRFLIERLAQYEGDFIEDNEKITKYMFVERGNTDEDARIEDFKTNHSEDRVWHNFITHPKSQRSFNLLISYR